MIRYALPAVLLVLSACKDTSESAILRDRVKQLQEQALQDDTVWRLLESLTTRVGSRMAGSEGDAKAVAWARANMLELGFDRVWLEHVDFPMWLRNSEQARVIAPGALDLDVTALGGSPGTGGALRGEIVHFENLEALEAAGDEEVGGKIAFISERMVRSRDDPRPVRSSPEGRNGIADPLCWHRL
jgi:hypothetical protein